MNKTIIMFFMVIFSILGGCLPMLFGGGVEDTIGGWGILGGLVGGLFGVWVGVVVSKRVG